MCLTEQAGRRAFVVRLNCVLFATLHVVPVAGTHTASPPLPDRLRPGSLKGTADAVIRRADGRMPPRYSAAARLRFWRLFTRSSTTLGSARVDVSPRFSKESSAILRRMRRMIFPDRVLGRFGANWMRSGEAIGPISLRTQATSSLRNGSL